MKFKTLSSALVLSALLAGQAAIAMDTPDETTHTPTVTQTGESLTPEDTVTLPPLPSTPPSSVVQPEEEREPSAGGVAPSGNLTQQELLITSHHFPNEAADAATKAEKAASPDATEQDQKEAEAAADALIQKGLALKNNGTLSTLEVKEEKTTSWTSSIWNFLTKSKTSSSSNTPQTAEPSKHSSSSWWGGDWKWGGLIPWRRSTAVVTEVNGEVVPAVVQNMTRNTKEETTATTPADTTPTPEVTQQPELVVTPAPAPASETTVPPTETAATPEPTAEVVPFSTETAVQSQ